MNFNHLWFIKYDAALLADSLDYPHLLSLINNRVHFLDECNETGVQLHLFELIGIVDTFFDPAGIVELISVRQDMFTDQQLQHFEKSTTQLRVLIECEKSYANLYWINKKLEWNVEVRILATLLRVYIFLVMFWEFLVGSFPNIRTRQKKSRLILPLTRLEPFVNAIYNKLQKIEAFYYKYEYPHILQIHLLFKAYKTLLFGFPNLTSKQIARQFDLKTVVLNQNQLYKQSFRTKVLRVASPLRRIKPRRNTVTQTQTKIRSLQIRDRWLRYSGNLKVERCATSLLNVVAVKPEIPDESVLFRPVVISRRDKMITQSSMKRTNSQYASTRSITQSRSHLPSISKLVTIDQSVRQCMSPTRIPKARTRRTVLDPVTVSNITEDVPSIKHIDFQTETLKQKDLFHYSLMKYHETEVRSNWHQKRQLQLKLNDEVDVSPGTPRQLPVQDIEDEMERVLFQEIRLRPLGRDRYYKETEEQQ